MRDQLSLFTTWRGHQLINDRATWGEHRRHTRPRNKTECLMTGWHNPWPDNRSSAREAYWLAQGANQKD